MVMVRVGHRVGYSRVGLGRVGRVGYGKRKIKVG